MTQISKGDTFVDGQQVTGSRLNQLVDSAQILIGAITDQTALTSATVAADDQFLVSDTSTGLLKNTTAGDILGSSLPVVASTVTATSVTSSTVNAGLNSDIVVTPYDGIPISGKAFTSVDGNTTTVTSTAHGLVAGMIVNITASNTAYSGTYVIVVPTVDTFAYSVYPTTTAASGTCSYTRKATQRVIGNHNVIGNTNIAGNETVGGNVRVLGSVTAASIIGNIDTTSTGVTQVSTDDSTKVATTSFVKHNPTTCKAWVKFAGATGTVSASYNVTSVTRTTTGTYTVNITTALADANFAVISNCTNASGIAAGWVTVTGQTTNSASVYTVYPVSYGGANLNYDPTSVYVAIFGN